ncbi:MAG TPA: 30S ribosomal protein S17e [Candidatus Bathyarchaeota archaeon]|mgnify:CR=1 FL=1|nr:30S ribosomal protein S17e [Candidatus Bathyarchaeota archaeon]
MKAWGKVRIELETRIARELVERFPDKFTTDFETNKKLVDTFTNISSKKLRNKIAGYITHLQNQKKRKKLTPEQIEINSTS